MKSIFCTAVTLVAALFLASCEDLPRKAISAYMAVSDDLETSDGELMLEHEGTRLTARALIDGLEFPWDFVFIDRNQVLITEKPGRLLLLNLQTGERRNIDGLPDVLYRGQGGLLGVVLAPDFSKSQRLYLSYSKRLGGGKYSTALASAVLANGKLQQFNEFFVAQPGLSGAGHFGGSLLFDREAKLYLSSGDRQQREYAQPLNNHLGKVLRFNADGSIPSDNPFLGRDDALPEIYSHGHRNPQGLTLHPQSGEIWLSEHGPQGGDEINVVRAGVNYGWPVITYGEEYGGGYIGPGKQSGLAQPEHYYVPSIATAGIGFYHGDAFPQWQGDLFVTGLRGLHINRLERRDSGWREYRLLEDLGMRWRAVRQGPDGLLYALSENGSLLRLSPAQ